MVSFFNCNLKAKQKIDENAQSNCIPLLSVQAQFRLFNLNNEFKLSSSLLP